MNQQKQNLFDLRNLFSTDIETKTGNEASTEIIDECIKISNMMKSLLGPKSKDKLMVEFDGNIINSNDGAFILQSIQFSHPISKLLVELSTCMDDEVGDGTTSVIILVGSLLQKAKAMLSKGVHPRSIIRGYSKCLTYVDDFFIKNSLEFDPFSEEGRKFLMKISTTTLNSKFVSLSYPELSNFSLNSILKSNGNLDDIQLIKVKNGTISDSQFFEDSILLRSDLKCNLKNAKIALIDFDLNMPRTNKNYSLVISSSNQLDRIIKEEESYFKGIMVQLKKNKVGFVISQQNFNSEGVSDTLIQMFSKYKIQLVQNLKKDLMKKIVKLSKSTLMTSHDQLKESSNFGTLEEILSIEIGIQNFIVLKGVKSTYSSIILRGPSDNSIEETERALIDSLKILAISLKTPRICSGGGSLEYSFSYFLKSLNFEDLTHHLSTIAFSDALEQIPVVLCENFGYKPTTMLNKLQIENKHGNFNFGISSSGDVKNMFEIGVIEPMQNKITQIKMATQTAIQILKINGMIISK
eukprot:gene6384-10391_t